MRLILLSVTNYKRHSAITTLGQVYLVIMIGISGINNSQLPLLGSPRRKDDTMTQADLLAQAQVLRKRSEAYDVPLPESRQTGLH